MNETDRECPHEPSLDELAQRVQAEPLVHASLRFDALSYHWQVWRRQRRGGNGEEEAMSAKQLTSAAIVTIFDAPSMTKKGRKAIAAWLRQHAQWLEEDGWNYATRFIGRYQIRSDRRR